MRMQWTLLGVSLAGMALQAQTFMPTRVIEEPELREADIMWSKRVWSLIDLRQKMNHPWLYPIQPSPGRYSLFQILKKALEDQKVTPYRDDAFMEPMSHQAALALGSRTDTVMIPEPNPPYRDRPQVIHQPLDVSTILFFRIREEWIFDKQRSTLRYFPEAICPVRQVMDPSTGELVGYQDMFWIDFKQLRPFLFEFPFYNTQNSKSTITFAQAFQIRYYQSIIYKEDNVYDRALASVHKGVDAILAGEGIREHIRTFESDLWER
jgi:gliding motility associated protien GldN